MAEVINLTEYIKKRKEKEVRDLATKLAEVIEDLDLEENFQVYSPEMEAYSYGMPYIYTISAPSDVGKSVKNLADITDILTTLTISLDGMGYNKWANQISSVVGEMFASGSCKEG